MAKGLRREGAGLGKEHMGHGDETVNGVGVKKVQYFNSKKGR